MDVTVYASLPVHPFGFPEGIPAVVGAGAGADFISTKPAC